MALSDERFLLLTTFRKVGTPVATPVWAAPLRGGELGFWTSSGSGKAKRLRHTERVTVQPCDARGTPTPGTEVVEATARLVADGPQLEEVRRGIRAKYGLQARVVPYLVRLATLVRGKRSPYGDVAVVIRVA